MGEDRAGGDRADDWAATEREAGRYTVAEAAGALGISAEAVRSRVKRGTLPHVKDGETVYVLLSSDQTTDRAQPSYDQATPERDRAGDRAALVEDLREQVAYLRGQLDAEREARTEERRRQDTIIAQLSAANAEQARTIREITPPDEAPGGPETGEAGAREAASGTGGAEHPSGQQTAARRPWWIRLLGG